jgi:hypothetical protein
MIVPTGGYTRDQNFTQAKMQRRLTQIDEASPYLSQPDTTDCQGKRCRNLRIC